MKPVEFEGSNVVYAKDQPPYLPLPAHRNEDGRVTSCWQLSVWERFKILLTGRIFWTQMTFDQPLQPIRPSLEFPLVGGRCGVGESYWRLFCEKLLTGIPMPPVKPPKDVA